MSQQAKFHCFQFFQINPKRVLHTYSAKEVVEHQMTVGVGVVVHVLQDPEEDMIQAHLEGVEVVGLQDEEAL